MKKIVIGTLAHVDAGKTTLTESLLYSSGSINQFGRVDHGNSFLDFDFQERNRGITIFLKQAVVNLKDTKITLIDTPGHIDFSTEMERALQILDYAIIVINATDSVQAHTITIWNLLKHYNIPVFIFVNKMDISYLNQTELMSDLKNKLSDKCLDFTSINQTFYENIALCNEVLLESYLENQSIQPEMITKSIYNREIFPCFFGSALNNLAIDEFLTSLDLYTLQPQYNKDFGAKVFKITHDEQGNRLTHLKITGGNLKVKTALSNSEKIDQIRIYSGSKYQVFDEVLAGDICAIKGLKSFKVGSVLGVEEQLTKPLLSSCMHYRVILPNGVDQYQVLSYLHLLADEDPTLHINYNEQLQEIRVQLMGEIQTEILKNIISERFGIKIDFDQGNIIYKETILETVEGVGHYEPLRHYAEVHLLLEPGVNGSGLVFESKCLEENLEKRYQKSVLTHLEEKKHLGVLTGSMITDLKITLLTGKAHLKHTDGGDFREATYRAVRQGLKAGKSILLEPYYNFLIELPSKYLSRAIYDIELMSGSFEILDNINDITKLTGQAPVRKMQNYQINLASYTKGVGRITCFLDGYKPCLNQEEIIELIGYNSEEDLENPTGSIFCKQGAGFYVPWNLVKDYMHINFQYQPLTKKTSDLDIYTPSKNYDQELEEIFKRTYGETKIRLANEFEYQLNVKEASMLMKSKVECLLVDGYNIIYDWIELKTLAKENLDAARVRLIDILSNYQGYKQCLLIIVFDAYKVKQNLGSLNKQDNIFIVYTKEAQTADMYIERVTKELASEYSVIVATSDSLEQTIVIGLGARRMSARELKIEVEYFNQEMFNEFERKNLRQKAYLLEGVKDYKE